MSVGGSVFPFSFFIYRSFDENQQNWSNLHQRTKVFPNFFVRKLRNFARKKTPVGGGVWEGDDFTAAIWPDPAP
jgi:hypothetical protein